MLKSDFELVIQWNKGHQNEVKALVRKIESNRLVSKNLSKKVKNFLDSSDQFFELLLELLDSLEFLSHFDHQIEELDKKDQKKSYRLNLFHRWCNNSNDLLVAKGVPLEKRKLIETFNSNRKSKKKYLNLLKDNKSYVIFYDWLEKKIDLILATSVFLTIDLLKNIDGLNLSSDTNKVALKAIAIFNDKHENIRYLKIVEKRGNDSEEEQKRITDEIGNGLLELSEKKRKELEKKIKTAASEENFVEAQRLKEKRDKEDAEINRNKKNLEKLIKIKSDIFILSDQDLAKEVEIERKKKEEKKKQKEEKENEKEKEKKKEEKEKEKKKKKEEKGIFYDEEIIDLLSTGNLSQAFWLSKYSKAQENINSEEYLALTAYGSSAYPNTKMNESINNKECFEENADQFKDVPEDGSPESWMTIAACLKPLLFYQDCSHLYSFVHLKSNIKSVDEIFNTSVEVFKERIYISTSIFHQQEDVHRNLKKDAEDLLIKARKGHYGSKTPAGIFIKSQFRKGRGDNLGGYLEVINKDQKKDLQKLYDFSKGDAEEFIINNTAPGKRLEGTMKRQILFLVKESFSLIHEWSGLLLRSQGKQQHNQDDLVKILKQQYKEASKKIEKEVKVSAGDSKSKVAAGKVLSLVIKDVNLLLQGKKTQIISPQSSLLLKDLNLDNNFCPLNLTEQNRTKITDKDLLPEEAYQLSMKSGELLRAERIMSEYPTLKTEEDYSLDLNDFFDSYRELLIESKQNIETLYQLGLTELLEEELDAETWRTKHLNLILKLETKLNDDPQNGIDFSDSYQYQKVLDRSNEFKKALGKIKVDREKEVKLISEKINNDNDRKVFLDQSRAILGSNDLQALGDYLNSVKSSLNKGNSLTLISQTSSNDLEAFQDWEEDFDKQDLANKILIGLKDFDKILEKEELSISLEERNLIYYLVNHPENPELVLEKISDILGLNLGKVISKKLDNSIPAHELIFNLNVMPHSPVPEFGSAVSDKRLKLITIKELFEVNNDALKANIIYQGSYGSYPTIIFIPQFLSKKTRIEFSKSNLRESSKALLVDLSVLIFSCRAEDKQGTFFNITLPFSSINPFITEDAVPKELFFGRDAQIDSLREPKGGNIVYGGRQLGKSSLLKHLKDSSRDGTYVVWKQLKEFSTGNISYKEALYNFWIEYILEPLQDDKVLQREKISKNQNTFRPAEVIKIIKNRLRKPGRIIICLDESDNFLEWDSKNDFSVVSSLAGLMRETDFRFKVVYAGLRSVQRFSHIGNQPFAQLGQEIVVGALEVEPAQQLVVGMLDTLGYSFEESYLFNHMMSLVNYQASLIQVYCAEIVKNLRGSREGNYRTIIRRSDLDNIEENTDFIREIKYRFEITLALDLKYKCIAFAYILELDDQDFHTSIYFKDLGRRWVPSLFNNLSTSQIQTVLNEMTGLGLLSRSGDDEYQLKSPNMKRLFDNKDELMDALEDINRIGVIEVNTDNQRRKLSDGGYSVFTSAQENSLFDRRKNFSITIILASQMNGFNQIENHIDSTHKVLKWERSALSRRNDGQKFLFKNFSEKLKKVNRQHVYGIIDMGHRFSQKDFFEELRNLKDSGSRSCRDTSKGRLFVLTEPEVYWKNFSYFKEFLLTSIEPWSDGAIGKVLSNMELNNISEPSAAKEIVALTGGHHNILDAVLKTIKDNSVGASYKRRIEHIKTIAERHCYLDHTLQDLGLNELDDEQLKVFKDWIAISYQEENDSNYDGIELENGILGLVCEDKKVKVSSMDILIQYLVDVAILKEKISDEEGKWTILPGTAKLILGEDSIST